MFIVLTYATQHPAWMLGSHDRRPGAEVTNCDLKYPFLGLHLFKE
jgi:hypothetical protein